MRRTSLLGVGLLVAGLATLYLGGRFASDRDVLQVQDVRVVTHERWTVTPWIATAAMLAGTVLLLVGGGAAGGAERVRGRG